MLFIASSVENQSEHAKFRPVNSSQAETEIVLEDGVELRIPHMYDGRHMWNLAKATGVLDLNSSYSYILWCRDFAETSVVAYVDGQPAGFITAYRRPQHPDTLMVWQVAVNADFRGRKIAGSMLDQLVKRTRAQRLETTITDDNAASHRLFTSLAERHGATCQRSPLITTDMYPDDHDTEYLYEIAPLSQ